MNRTALFRIGGFCVATCSALLGGPAAIASAQPSDSHQRVAPTAPKATANASSPTGLKTVIEADAARRLQMLQGQQAKLQQSTAKIEGAGQAKLAKEKEALLGLKSTSTAAHLQATASNQQLMQAVTGISSGIAGTGLKTLSEATKTAEKADAAALQAQVAVNEAARLAQIQTQINTLTADLLSTMAKIEQARIDTVRMILRG